MVFGLAIKSVQEGQEFEGPDEKRASARRMVRGTDRNEQFPIGFIDLDNLAGPNRAIDRVACAKIHEVVGGIDIASE